MQTFTFYRNTQKNSREFQKQQLNCVVWTLCTINCWWKLKPCAGNLELLYFHLCPRKCWRNKQTKCWKHLQWNESWRWTPVWQGGGNTSELNQSAPSSAAACSSRGLWLFAGLFICRISVHVQDIYIFSPVFPALTSRCWKACLFFPETDE